jgi:hypothetical protein
VSECVALLLHYALKILSSKTALPPSCSIDLCRISGRIIVTITSKQLSSLKRYFSNELLSIIDPLHRLSYSQHYREQYNGQQNHPNIIKKETSPNTFKNNDTNSQRMPKKLYFVKTI